MVQVLRDDADARDAVAALVEVDVGELRRELRELDREVGVLHLSGHHLGERAAAAPRRVDHEPRGRREERGEEREALDVVPVGVAQQERRGERPRARAGEGGAERADAGAAVEHEPGAAAGRHLDARRVAAEVRGAGAGRRDGPARAPEADVHGSPGAAAPKSSTTAAR